MNPDQRRAFRALTHAYFARPDPTSWLLAADLLEECGRDEEARKWRRRGEWYPALRDAVQKQVDYAAAGYFRTFYVDVDISPFRVQFGSLRPLSEVSMWPEIFSASCWMSKGGGWVIHSLYFIGRPADGDRYYNRRTIELVDRLVEAEEDMPIVEGM